MLQAALFRFACASAAAAPTLSLLVQETSTRRTSSSGSWATAGCSVAFLLSPNSTDWYLASFRNRSWLWTASMKSGSSTSLRRHGSNTASTTAFRRCLRTARACASRTCRQSEKYGRRCLKRPSRFTPEVGIRLKEEIRRSRSRASQVVAQHARCINCVLALTPKQGGRVVRRGAGGVRVGAGGCGSWP